MPGNDAYLKLPVQHAALYGVERRHMQMQAHIGRHLGKVRNGRTNVRLRVGGGFVKHRNVQLTTHALVNLVHPAAKSVHAAKQAQGLKVYLLALRRHGKAGPPAPAQAKAQAGFKVLDVAAHGRHTNVELQLGCSHATALYDALEHPQQANVHVAQLTQGRPALYLHKTTTKV